MIHVPNSQFLRMRVIIRLISWMIHKHIHNMNRIRISRKRGTKHYGFLKSGSLRVPSSRCRGLDSVGAANANGGHASPW